MFSSQIFLILFTILMLITLAGLNLFWDDQKPSESAQLPSAQSISRKVSSSSSVPTTPPTPPNRADSLGDWLVYQNKYLGIAFEYPRKFQESVEYSHCLIRESASGLGLATKVAITIKYMEDTMNEYIEQYNPEYAIHSDLITAKQSPKVLQIDGSSNALLLSYRIDPWHLGSSHKHFRNPPMEQVAFIQRHDQLYVVGVADGVTACALIEEQIADEEVFQRVLSSLRFLR